MGHVYVTRCPRRLAGWRTRAERAAEEGQLKAKAPAIVGGEVAGVVPPFGLEGRVRAVIGRKHEQSRRRDTLKPFTVISIDRLDRADACSHGRLSRRCAGRQREHNGYDEQKLTKKAHNVWQVATVSYIESLFVVYHGSAGGNEPN